MATKNPVLQKEKLKCGADTYKNLISSIRNSLGVKNKVKLNSVQTCQVEISSKWEILGR